ncbi:YHS domain-containing (seleno)protein [Acanthopleuribacter pedis]|uniref:YHS domain-containing protein n=1 Tax=Acanthopleuribacter pedis TaxID=442870 RepID=A0A8J7QFC1_9BACT|nr:YHS domain-containing (seleno)protein [Acanthopleuribacter pedis]MBO1323044.1 YHS domain-containing protein [Acanthopleuribacter pedis]
MNLLSSKNAAAKTFFSTLAVLFFSGALLAVEPVNQTFFGVAIKGYDPVAYFTESKPVKGSKEHKLEWNGATWYFAGAENKSAFEKEPEKYAPQYGGYCAYAVSQNATAGIDPDAWKILDGKLYLNYNAKIQKKWEKDIPGYIKLADEHWPGLLKK